MRSFAPREVAVNVRARSPAKLRSCGPRVRDHGWRAALERPERARDPLRAFPARARSGNSLI